MSGETENYLDLRYWRYIGEIVERELNQQDQVQRASIIRGQIQKGKDWSGELFGAQGKYGIKVAKKQALGHLSQMLVRRDWEKWWGKWGKRYQSESLIKTILSD